MTIPLVAGTALGIWSFAFLRALTRRLWASRQASREARVLTDDRLEEWMGGA